ncbi:MAG: phytoene desaturase [Gluconacetobacter diazotrophicus]|nr:phytoene desaturase [Gluconacetobacter diazotrophicus]
MTGAAPPFRSTPPRTIVIGAGFGGLAAALRARALGHRVTVLDRLEQPGGRARCFRRDGFSFDAGPTVITAPDLLDALWALFGERRAEHVVLLPVEPWYRIRFHDGRHFDYGGDLEQMRRKVSAFSPADERGFLRLAARAARFYRVGYERLGTRPFHRAATMLAAVPALIGLRAWRPLYAFVSRFIRDESLRRVFTLQVLLIGGHPFRSPALYALIGHLERVGGVWFVRGGTAALVAALVALAERHGVEFRFGAEVTAVLVERGAVSGVRLASGEVLPADAVISDVDPVLLYGRLLPPAARGRWSPRRLRRLQPSMGLFVLYFGTDRRYGDVPHHTMVLGRSFRALLDEVFGTDAVAPPQDPSLYLHRPTATDPDLAPPGHDAFYVLAPVPCLRAPIDWTTGRRVLRDRVVAMLSDTVLPGLSRHIVSESSLAPPDFAADYLSQDGTGFALAPTLLQSAFFRFHNRDRLVSGLFLVGAGTHPGAGVPGVLCSAALVGELLRSWTPARAPVP